MQNLSRRTLAFCVLLLGATVSLAAAATALPCADYVSTGLSDAPGEGHLVGSETVSYTIEGNLGAGGGGVEGGLGAGRTVTYEVGYYQFTNGRTYRIDCRNYTLA